MATSVYLNVLMIIQSACWEELSSSLTCGETKRSGNTLLTMYKSIGVYANWFHGTNVNVPDIEDKDIVNFIPLINLVFTPGYLSLENYVSIIDDSSLVFHADYSFSIPVAILEHILPQWKVQLTFDL